MVNVWVKTQHMKKIAFYLKITLVGHWTVCVGIWTNIGKVIFHFKTKQNLLASLRTGQQLFKTFGLMVLLRRNAEVLIYYRTKISIIIMYACHISFTRTEFVLVL